jgi:hypothetical protein
VALAPGREAAFFVQSERRVGDETVVKILRHHHPSFKLEGEYRLPFEMTEDVFSAGRGSRRFGDRASCGPR